ncbi:aminoacyl-tRNA hydrolase [bacterium]|nr:aminoacyl-tRNA hydrolase [bacterium]
MKLIVGLGNYEPKYLFTRHNAGFMALDFFAQEQNATFKTEQKFKADIAKIKVNGDDVILVKPLTFMNLSGEAVVAVSNFYKISTEDILVVYDDITRDLGTLRFRANGSDGGHNGIKSIINLLGTNKLHRVKIGIGPQPNIPSESFVLQKFSDTELETLKTVLKKPFIEDYLKFGIEKSQNLYN